MIEAFARPFVVGPAFFFSLRRSPLALHFPVSTAMFKSFWGSQDQQSQSGSQGMPTQSWYPPSVTGGSSSSLPSTPGSTSSSFSSPQRASDRPQSPSYGQFPPAEAAGVISILRDKSIDELRKLLNDKDAYTAFLHSLEQVKVQNSLRNELRKETTQLARGSLEKEPRILELRNQCRIIRTTELAAAQEKVNDLERKKDEILKNFAPATLIRRLHESMIKIDEESEKLHNQLLAKEIDLAAFVQNSKKMRTTYHRRALLHLGAKTSAIS